MVRVCIQKVKAVFTRYLGFSKADGVFIAYTWWMVLPVMAMPTPEPEVDSSVLALRAQFIIDAGLIKLQRKEEDSLTDSGYLSPREGFGSRGGTATAIVSEESGSSSAEGDGRSSSSRAGPKNDLDPYAFMVTGDVLSAHGLKTEEGARGYQLPSEGSHSRKVGSLTIQTPSTNYLQQKGLYHGYRLLVGDGYVVPSMLVQFKRNGSLTSSLEAGGSSSHVRDSDTSPLFWLIEVMPYTPTSTPLVDLKDTADSYSLGVHLLSSMLFNTASASYTQATNSGAAEPVQRVLTSVDSLEGDISSDLMGLNKKVVPKGLKQHLSKVTLQHYIPYWLKAMNTAIDQTKDLGHREDLKLKLNTAFTLASRLHKLSGLFSSPYDMTYEDVQKMMGQTIRETPDETARPLKEITLLSLYDLFFKHRTPDWTEVFEIVGETFPTYASYFEKQKHLYTDTSLLQQALQKNRAPSVLTFMREGGLRPDTLAQTHILHQVVHISGRKLDTDKAKAWIQSFADLGLNLEEQDGKNNTALDLALQQHKQEMIIELIHAGAGSRVKPSYILDYLKVRKEQGQSTLGRSSGARATSLSPLPGEEQDDFEQAIHLLEFRSHQLRWHLTLESLLPLYTGQKGLKIKTTDHERVLKPEYVQSLWKGGKAKKPNTFQSFTQTIDQQKYGRRTVGRITDGRYTLYVKQYPELPGIEEAVGFLTRQLLGYGAPNTLLANIEGAAYLFSEGISGQPLHDYLTGHTDIPWPVINTNLDAESTSGMILLAMLTNPEDGKPDNYIVQERPDGRYQIVGIDNDHSFVPTASKIKGKVKMNVKSILFALEQMNEPLHQNLKRKFMYHRPGDIIREWVGRLTNQAVKYNELFSQKEILNHFSKQNTFLGIALHPSIVEDLYKNLSSLQSLIQGTEDLTHMDILRNFHRTIYLRYQDGFTEHPTANPLDRFKYVDGKKYKLSKKKGLQTLSTGSNLLSTNMMITTKKDLQEYVKRARGKEIGLEQALKTLEEIEANDTRQLAEQAMAQAGSTIPLNQMTDGQREDFFERLDWSKLPIQNQQALVQQMARESWGDPTLNKSPWRGKLTFKNCSGFTEGGLFTQGNAIRINWQAIRRVDVEIDEKGREAALKSLQILNQHLPEGVDLHLKFKDLDLNDEGLDEVVESAGAHLKKLHLHNLAKIKDPELRQKAPGLIWEHWIELEDIRYQLRAFALERSGQQTLNLDWYKINIGDAGAQALAAVLQNSQVQTLNLRNNEIGDAGVKALAAVLKDSQVQSLNLGSNEIGDALESDLKQIIEQNKKRLKGTSYELKNKRKEIPQLTKGSASSFPSQLTQPQQDLDLSTLLTSAGLTGEGELPEFEDGLDRAGHLVEDGQESLNAAALELIVQELEPSDSSRLGGAVVSAPKPISSPVSQEENAAVSQVAAQTQKGPSQRHKVLTFDEEGFGFGEEASTDDGFPASTLSVDTTTTHDREESDQGGVASAAIDSTKLHQGKGLLEKLSARYPKASLSLAEVCLRLGKVDESIKAFELALINRVPGTLEQIESVVTSHRVQGRDAAQLALFLSHNYLEGLLTPVEGEKGEQWLRQAVAFDPENMDLTVQLVSFLIDQGGLESAESFKEITQLVAQAKATRHPQGLSLSLMIEQIQKTAWLRMCLYQLGIKLIVADNNAC